MTTELTRNNRKPAVDLRAYEWYEWALMGLLALTCIFSLIDTVKSAIQVIHNAYYFDFGDFLLLVVSIIPGLFALVLPVLIALLLLRQSVYAKDAVLLYVLLFAIGRAYSISRSLFYYAAGPGLSDAGVNGMLSIAASLLLTAAALLPFFKPVKIAPYLACGLCVANVALRTFTFGFLILWAPIVEVWTVLATVLCLLYTAQEARLFPGFKPFGFALPSPLFAVSPVAVAVLLGGIDGGAFLPNVSGPGFNWADNLVFPLLCGLLKLYLIIRLLLLLLADRKAVQAQRAAALPAGESVFRPGNLGAAPAAGGIAVTPAELAVEMVKHVLLLLFTFGVYFFIWIYKTTQRLNLLSGEAERNPGYKLLLCLFVPFYYIYWAYQSAQIVDRCGKRGGDNGEISLAVLLTALFAFPMLVPPILIQNKMNRMAGQ